MRLDRTGTRVASPAPRPHRPCRLAPRIVSPLAVLPLSACTGAPAINVVGSYFPAWMLCALIGIVSAVVLRQVLVMLDLESVLVLPLITHALVAAAVTLAVWLLWFGH